MTVQLPTADPRPTGVNGTARLGEGTRILTGTAQPPAAPASNMTRHLSPRLRKAILAAHVLVGVGWFGIVVAKLVLEIAAASTRDQEIARAGFLFMQALDRAVFPPAALATLITGVFLSVGTAWGLFRHWWIVVKLVLTIGVIVTGVAFVGAWTEQALASAAGPAGQIGDASRWLIGAAVAHVLMLGAATVISIYKPWGRIRPEPRRTRRRAAPATTP
jgi:hypothetical protein